MHQMTDASRAALERLERVKKPSQWERGELSALRMVATDPDDQRRIAGVAEQWAAADERARRKTRDQQHVRALGLDDD